MGTNNYKSPIINKIKDKIIIVLGLTGVGKSSFIYCITKNNKYCKAIDINHPRKVNLGKEGYNFYFVDTPGLDGGYGEQNEAIFPQLNELRNLLPQINAFILCLSFFDYRITKTLFDTLSILMKIYPCENFWNNVLIIRTFSIRNEGFEKSRKRIEDLFLENIKKNIKLIEFMRENNINIPSKIKEYFVDCNTEEDEIDQATLNEFDAILGQISKLYPICKEIKEELNICVKEEKIGELKIIHEIKNKCITFKDFNGQIDNATQKMNEEKYYLNALNNKDILNETLENKINYIKNLDLNELKILLVEEKDKNKKLENELNEAKNKIIKYENDLKKQIDEDNTSKKILEKETKEFLIETIFKKDKEIQELKSKLSSLQITLKEKKEEQEKIITIIIISSDEKLQYSVICKTTDEFTKIENQLYENYPEYNEINNNFILKGKIINKNLTLEQNGIKNNDIIILKIND